MYIKPAGIYLCEQGRDRVPLTPRTPLSCLEMLLASPLYIKAKICPIVAMYCTIGVPSQQITLKISSLMRFFILPCMPEYIFRAHEHA